MKYRTLLIHEAEDDLLDIYRYIAKTDSEHKDIGFLSKIEAACLSLESLPDKGHIPPELEQIGIGNYREIRCKPYPIFYETIDKTVFIHAILDGRRDLKDLLERRMIR